MYFTFNQFNVAEQTSASAFFCLKGNAPPGKFWCTFFNIGTFLIIALYFASHFLNFLVLK